MPKTIALIILLLAVNTVIIIFSIKVTEQLLKQEGLCIVPHIRGPVEVYKCN